MEERCLLRTITSISFAGVIFKDITIEKMKGIMMKMSDESNIRIWCPYNEIESIILPNGKIINKGELNNFLKNMC
jgi:hypothetical protein